jgi:putative protein kinase ArgK-like GTPase of G3E family
MELVKKVLNNDRASIAKAITLVESSNPKDKEESKQLISSLINHPGSLYSRRFFWTSWCW